VKRTKEESAVLAEVAHMPFGVTVPYRLSDGPVTLERIADYLKALREVLEGHTKRCRARDAELTQIKDDVDGMRRLFGVPPLDTAGRSG